MITPSTTWLSGANAFRAAATSATASETSARNAAVLAVLLLGLVAIELVGAQPHARGDRGRLSGFMAPIGSSAMMVTAPLPARSLPAADAAEFEEIVVLEAGRLAGADHDQTRWP